MKALQIAILVLCSLVATWIFGPAVLRGYASMHWPLVEAEVLESRRGKTTGNRQSLHVDVRYAYSRGGRAYGGDNVDFRILGPFVEPPPKGSKVVVAVNPANAGESVLRPGFSPFDLATIVISWLATLMLIAHAVIRQLSRKA